MRSGKVSLSFQKGGMESCRYLREKVVDKRKRKCPDMSQEHTGYVSVEYSDWSRMRKGGKVRDGVRKVPGGQIMNAF